MKMSTPKKGCHGTTECTTDASKSDCNDEHSGEECISYMIHDEKRMKKNLKEIRFLIGILIKNKEEQKSYLLNMSHIRV
jgi:hypothetical protein